MGGLSCRRISHHLCLHDLAGNEMKNRDWMKHAECRGMGPTFFFADVGDVHTIRTAMEVCNGTNDTSPCPVKDQCLEYALSFSDDDDRYGVFGGLVPHRRSEIRKERRRAETVAATKENSELKLLLDLVHEAVMEHESRRIVEKQAKYRSTIEAKKTSRSEREMGNETSRL